MAICSTLDQTAHYERQQSTWGPAPSLHPFLIFPSQISPGVRLLWFWAECGPVKGPVYSTWPCRCPAAKSSTCSKFCAVHRLADASSAQLCLKSMLAYSGCYEIATRCTDFIVPSEIFCSRHIGSSFWGSILSAQSFTKRWENLIV